MKLSIVLFLIASAVTAPQSIGNIRSDYAEMAKSAVVGSRIQEWGTSQIKLIFTKWVSTTLETLVPQKALLTRDNIKWAMGMCGSGGRNEMSPYSDIDVFVVLGAGQSNADTKAIKEAFHVLARQMIETNMDGEFKDLMYCPMVNFLNKNLVDEPSNLGEFISTAGVGELTNCLPEGTAIMQSPGITDDEASRLLLDVTASLALSKPEAQDDLKEWPATIAADKPSPWNIKADFYRPLQQMANRLMLYFETKDIRNTFMRLDWLQEQEHLNPSLRNKWKDAYNIVAKLRIKAESFAHGEHHEVYFGDEEVPDKRYKLTAVEKRELDLVVQLLHALREKARLFGRNPQGSTGSSGGLMSKVMHKLRSHEREPPAFTVDVPFACCRVELK